MVKIAKLKEYKNKKLKGFEGDAKKKIEHYIERYNKRIEKFNGTIKPRLEQALKKSGNQDFKVIKTSIEDYQKSMEELKKAINSTKGKPSFKTYFPGKMLIGRICDEYEELKEIKRCTKKSALKLGVASRKSINNAHENLVADMINIKEEIDNYIFDASDENFNKVKKQINERKDKKCFYRASSILKKAAKYIEEEAGVEELVKKAISEVKTKANEDYTEQNGKIFNAKLDGIKEYSEKNCKSFVGESGKKMENIVSSAIQMIIASHICKELSQFILKTRNEINTEVLDKRFRAIQGICGWKIFANDGDTNDQKEIEKAEAEREERKKRIAEEEKKERKKRIAEAKRKKEAEREDEVMGELEKKVGLELEEEKKERKKRIAEAKRKKKEKEEKNKGNLKNKLKNSFVNMWKK